MESIYSKIPDRGFLVFLLEGQPLELWRLLRCIYSWWDHRHTSIPFMEVKGYRTHGQRDVIPSPKFSKRAHHICLPRHLVPKLSALGINQSTHLAIYLHSGR